MLITDVADRAASYGMPSAIVDGMDAARFVQALRGSLEAPATLFID